MVSTRSRNGSNASAHSANSRSRFICIRENSVSSRGPIQRTYAKSPANRPVKCSAKCNEISRGINLLSTSATATPCPVNKSSVRSQNSSPSQESSRNSTANRMSEGSVGIKLSSAFQERGEKSGGNWIKTEPS